MRDLQTRPWDETYRSVSREVLERYGVQRSNGAVVFSYRDSSGQVVARKFRDDAKKIWWEGSVKDITGFGMHLANPDHHDAVAITEGEMDAPSITAATKGRIVGVSVPNGANQAAKFVRERLDQFQRFRVVYVATDMDEPGETAAQELMNLFPSG